MLEPLKSYQIMLNILNTNDIACDELNVYETELNEKVKFPKNSTIIFSLPLLLNVFLTIYLGMKV